MAYIAVYGTLKKGFGNHSLINDAKHITTKRLEGYKMYSLGAFPAVNRSDDQHSIVVEVYKVNFEQLQDVRCLEGIPTFYQEDIVIIDNDGKKLPCFIYFMEKDLSDNHDEVDGGEW